MLEKVIYFSLNTTRKTNFYEFIRHNGICFNPKFSFSLEGEEEELEDPRDLINLIEKDYKKDSIHVIIDYVSLFGKGKEENYSTVIRDIIMCYPEVQFLFDETYVKQENAKRKELCPEALEYNFLNFLFMKSPRFMKDLKNRMRPGFAIDPQKNGLDEYKYLSNVLAEYHQFDMAGFKKGNVEEQFILLLKGRNNMYDGSNLRHAIKEHKYKKVLHVKLNYSKLCESRGNNAAITVEEEYHQSMFNGYCLYANGYRVFPIMTATELLWINKQKQHLGHPLLIRDYDLQFIDENRCTSNIKDKNIFINVSLSEGQYHIERSANCCADVQCVVFNKMEKQNGDYNLEFDNDQNTHQKVSIKKTNSHDGNCKLTFVYEDGVASVIPKEVVIEYLEDNKGEYNIEFADVEDPNLENNTFQRRGAFHRSENEREIHQEPKDPQSLPHSIKIHKAIGKDGCYSLLDLEEIIEAKANEIDYIRGAKAFRDLEDGSVIGFVEFDIDNSYWKSFGTKNAITYFVSKGEESLSILEPKNDDSSVKAMNPQGKCLELKGLKKPLEGIYASMQLIPAVNERYKDSRDIDAFKTSREGGEHGCPLDIYGIARSMVQRAERYYKFGRPRLAALVAGEALEVLNGFHKSLMNQAYYILSVSENAMAMSLLGGNEEMLKKDVNIRLRKKVKEDVDRMIADPKDRYNLLYNIFNDCMLFCQEKEYFGAADEALSAMVHEKEGVRLGKWIGDKCKTIGSFFKE